MAWAAKRKVMASIMPLPSLFTWLPRGTVKLETDRGHPRSSAQFRFTGTQARLELVPKAVIIRGDAFLRKVKGLYPVRTLRMRR